MQNQTNNEKLLLIVYVSKVEPNQYGIFETEIDHYFRVVKFTDMNLTDMVANVMNF